MFVEQLNIKVILLFPSDRLWSLYFLWFVSVSFSLLVRSSTAMAVELKKQTLTAQYDGVSSYEEWRFRFQSVMELENLCFGQATPVSTHRRVEERK